MQRKRASSASAHETAAAATHGPQELLKDVGRVIQRTRTSLKQSRLIHVFYALALPLYTLLGALVFQVVQTGMVILELIYVVCDNLDL